MQPLVSIVMPLYNKEQYVAEAIHSVIRQSYMNWELIIVNDGSTDSSLQIAERILDSRIIILNQLNQGVSAARNAALKIMRGDFFCFLDADDRLPVRAISSRVEIMQRHQNIFFVDGIVQKMDEKLLRKISTYTPSLTGSPTAALLKFSEKCFLGNTWMIRKVPDYHYAFDINLTHLEDYLFCLQISSQGEYTFVNEEVLHYRQASHSAMTDFDGLESSYYYVLRYIKQARQIDFFQLLFLRLKVLKIMVLIRIRLQKKVLKAVQSLFRFFP